MTLELISLNVERDKHLDRVLPFLEKEMPEVLCVQELYEDTIPDFLRILRGASHVYVPKALWREGEKLRAYGIGIFSRLPVEQHSVDYYSGGPLPLRELDRNPRVSCI